MHKVKAGILLYNIVVIIMPANYLFPHFFFPHYPNPLRLEYLIYKNFIFIPNDNPNMSLSRIYFSVTYVRRYRSHVLTS